MTAQPQEVSPAYSVTPDGTVRIRGTLPELPARRNAGHARLERDEFVTRARGHG